MVELKKALNDNDNVNQIVRKNHNFSMNGFLNFANNKNTKVPNTIPIIIGINE